MGRSFVDDIEAFIEKVDKRAMAVFHYSAQDVAAEVIKPRGEGGHIPFDTGFLRASFLGSLEAMPSIDPKAVPPKEAVAGSFPDGLGEINLVIAGATWDDTIYMGFTAAYAKRMEYGFTGTDSLGRKYNQAGAGFVRLAAQNWEHIVYQNALKAQKAYP